MPMASFWKCCPAYVCYLANEPMARTIFCKLIRLERVETLKLNFGYLIQSEKE